MSERWDTVARYCIIMPVPIGTMVLTGSDLRRVLSSTGFAENPPAGRGSRGARTAASPARHRYPKPFMEAVMANFRRLVSAMALSVVIGTGMVVTGPTVHAAAPGSDQSISVRCRLLQAALY